MSFDRRPYPLTQRAALALGAALLLTSAAYAAQATQPTEPADVCPALKHIVDAPDFKQLPRNLPRNCRHIGRGRLPRRQHAYDCHWRAHWQADGVVNDPLEEFGADIAACFPNSCTTSTRRRVSISS